MKVTKLGDKIEDIKTQHLTWTHQAKCGAMSEQGFSGCGSELEIKTPDVYKVEVQVPQGTMTRFCAKCPMCGSQVPIPYSELPLAHDSVPHQEEWLKMARSQLIHKLHYEFKSDWERIKGELLTDGISSDLFEELNL